jgi:hypothetical protein
MEYKIILDKREVVEQAFQSLAKRATRKGLPMPRWYWGKAYTVTEFHDNGKVEVERIPLHLEETLAKFSGWAFAATLQHVDGGNIIRCVPGQTIPQEYRNHGPKCDHCGYNRRRNDTFVVKHDDGRYTQVGSSCIDDFLGGADASKVAAQAEMLASLANLAESGEEYIGGGRVGKVTVLNTFLTVTAAIIRKHGWVSRSAAQDGGATADLVIGAVFGSKNCPEITDEDRAQAEAAEVWAESLTDECLAKQTSDYLHNVRTIARGGSVGLREAGIAASIIAAYQRNVMNERRVLKAMASVHVGTIGKRETFEVTLDNITGYETHFGYTTVVRFTTDDGAILVWKASADPDLKPEQVGKRFNLTGTVKQHSEYKGTKQTVVQRCKIVQA